MTWMKAGWEQETGLARSFTTFRKSIVLAGDYVPVQSAVHYFMEYISLCLVLVIIIAQFSGSGHAKSPWKQGYSLNEGACSIRNDAISGRLSPLAHAAASIRLIRAGTPVFKGILANSAS